VKQYLKERKLIYPFTAMLILLLIATSIAVYFSAARKELEGLKTRRDEMVMLKGEFLSLRTRIDSIERKKNLAKGSSIIPALEDLFASLGLKNRLKSIKPVANREVSGNVEEEAEVSVEKISMNEMVNLFYKAENTNMLLVLKKADIKTSFEKPDLFNLTLIISLLHER